MSYFGEEARSSPEIVKAHQPSITGDGIEIPLGAVVAGDARGHDQPCPATWADQIQKQFGEQGIGVHIAHAGQRIAPAVVGIEAGGLGAAPGGDEFFV